jgi:hypothetical protein
MRFLLLLWCSSALLLNTLQTQVDSIDYLIPFYVEDAMGNRDTAYIGGSKYALPDQNPQLGEVNLVDVPFDSVLEIRAMRTDELFDEDRHPLVISKRCITRFDDFGTPGDCFHSAEHQTLVIHSKYHPITISWEREVMEDGAALFCAQGTYIINTLAPYSYDYWYENAEDAEFEFACLSTQSSISYQRWEGFTGGPFGLDYALHHVAGSTNLFDTLQIYPIFGEYSQVPPCEAVISSQVEPREESVSIMAYPNPVNERLFLQTEVPETITSITILTIDGRAISHQSGYSGNGLATATLRFIKGD